MKLSFKALLAGFCATSVQLALNPSAVFVPDGITMPDNSLDEFQREAFVAHNRWRVCGGVPQVQWSETLAKGAKSYQDEQVKAGCNLVHSNAGDYRKDVNGPPLWKYVGESVFTVWGNQVVNGTSFTRAFHQEIKCYTYGPFNSALNQDPPDCGVIGHYTQVMWATTTHIGCSAQKCGDNGAAGICWYGKGGNINNVIPFTLDSWETQKAERDNDFPCFVNQETKGVNVEPGTDVPGSTNQNDTEVSGAPPPLSVSATLALLLSAAYVLG